MSLPHGAQEDHLRLVGEDHPIREMRRIDDLVAPD